MTKEALKLALEALEEADEIEFWNKQKQAITAIKKALAQDEQSSSQEPVLQDIEQYRLQMAAIGTAAWGYWKEGDGIHPDYDTLTFRDVLKLYTKYDALYKAQPDYKAQPEQEPGTEFAGVEYADNRDLRHFYPARRLPATNKEKEMKEALKLALVIEEFDKNDESLPLELLKPIAATLRALAPTSTQCEVQPEQERVAPTCERCADEIVENNAGLCANCLPAICTEQEPVFKWRSVFQEMPTEDSHLLFCFGVHVVEGSYTKKGWASLAYGEAQPDFWAYMPPAPHPKRNQELYAMPPQRPWAGLTAQEAADCWTTSATKTWHNFEAALRSKNI